MTGRLAALLLLTIALVVGLVAWGFTRNDAPHVTPPATGLVVGDSLVYQSANALRDQLRARGWTPVLDARIGSGILGGYTIDKWPPRIAQLVCAANPDVVVVVLGTNGCGLPCSSPAAAIDTDMALLRDVPFVYWVNVKENSPIPPKPHAINAALEQAKHRWDNLHVIDMNARFDDHRDLLRSDRIHFNRKGVLVFTELVIDALPPAH